MARDATDATPIESRDQLVEALSSGGKPKEAWRVGTEHEKFGFYLADHAPVPYEGERWPVRPERVAELLLRGMITPEQADGFLKSGALGSHLENLQRKGGFKGFNQKAVSAIIAATDPRKLQEAHATA